MGSLSSQAQEKLNGFRAEIDALDEKLIALFKERIKIVSEVGKLKRSDGNLQCFIRSGRESDMLRDIYAEFEDSPFHPEAACAIWRQLIAASTQHEAPMTLITPKSLEGAAKIYFADFMPVTHYENVTDAISILDQQTAAVIILPTPQDSPSEWQAFVKHAPDSLKIFAIIPFIGDQPQAFAAANLTPEPSRDDISLFADKSGQIEEVDGYTKEYPVASTDTKGHKRWLGTYGRPIKRK